jgi:DNA-binding transcriptional ArsR family regulator
VPVATPDITATALTSLGDDFARAIPSEDRGLADRAGLRLLEIPRGPWTPPPVDEPPRGVIVLAGALLRVVALAGRRFGQVVDDGEVLDPWHTHEGSLAPSIEWQALEPAKIAILDGRFERYAVRWPALHAVLQRRTAEQAARTAIHAAILSLPTVEQRLAGLLWHVADRRGTVTADGVVLTLDVTHAQLGALAGARRSTATLALKRLSEQGLVTRRADGRWVLSQQSREALDTLG